MGMEVKQESFGRFLLERGLLPQGRLEKATQVMVVFGGRLGTVLVEAGYLSVEEGGRAKIIVSGIP